MSVEQTRGRIDCGTQGVADAVSAERFRGVRIFDISDVKQPKQIAAVQTCRGSHTHTLVIDPKDHGQHLHLRIRHEHRAIGRRARRMLGRRSEGRSEHVALQHRRHPGAARGAGESARSSIGRAYSPTPGPAHISGLWPGRRSRPGHAEDVVDRPVPRHHRVSRNRSGGGRLLRQRHPARHLGSGAPGAAGSRSPTRTSRSGTRRRSTTTAPR